MTMKRKHGTLSFIHDCGKKPHSIRRLGHLLDDVKRFTCPRSDISIVFSMSSTCLGFVARITLGWGYEVLCIFR